MRTFTTVALVITLLGLCACGQKLTYLKRTLDTTAKTTTFSWTVTPDASTPVNKILLNIPSAYHVIMPQTNMQWVQSNGQTVLQILNTYSTAAQLDVKLWTAYKEATMYYTVYDANGVAHPGNSTGPYVAPVIDTSAATKPPDYITITVTVRDYSTTRSCAYSDFECFGGSGAFGELRSTLGNDGLPVMTNSNPSHQHNSESFDEWYRDASGKWNGDKYKFEIPLRFNKIYDNPPEYQHDDQLFLPLDTIIHCDQTTNPKCWGRESCQYNFGFTVTFTTTFTYHGGEAFAFAGDDDVWVFIDGRLAVDIGGMHGSLPGSVNLDNFGLIKNKTYSLSFFSAERHSTGSHFMATTSIIMQDCYAKDELGYCPGVCVKDSDGDNMPDCLDGCVSDPAKTSPGLCGCSGSVAKCTDGKPCTVDRCIEGKGCDYTQMDTCDDNNKCTVDSCDATYGCRHPPLGCDDGDPCTTDTCDPKTGCVHTDISCDDSNACTEDSCVHGQGCAHKTITCDDSKICTNDYCLPKDGCHFDTIVCDTTNKCYESVCQEDKGGCVKKICVDSLPCTNDTCDPAIGCVFPAIDPCTACGLHPIDCTSDTYRRNCYDSACEPTAEDPYQSHCAYTHWNFTQCNSHDPCIIDSCDPTTNTCLHTPVKCEHKTCMNVKCNSTGVCDYTPVVCVSPSPCMNAVCVNDACVVITNDLACPNITCKNKVCYNNSGKAGCNYTDIVCNYGTPCIISFCSNETGACATRPVDCTDNSSCTADSCGPTGCVHTPKYCEDGDPCTRDFCVEDGKNGTCHNVSKCDDGYFCTKDTCRATGTCEWPPLDCAVELNLNAQERKCFTTKCIEGKRRCVKSYLQDTLVDVCGGCVSLIKSQFNFTSSSSADETATCLSAWEISAMTVGLAAGVVAGIVIAVVIGVAIAIGASTLGTYELVKRAKEATSHGLVSNPLYEAKADNGENPYYAGSGSVSTTNAIDTHH